jgi:hypothetical protein
MGLLIAWEDENRRRLRDVVEPVDLSIVGLVAESQEEFELLRFIDPYGDTTFNRLQMSTFRTDWAKLHAEMANRSLDEFWTEVDRLAELCSREVHTYIRFIGD